MSEVRVNNLSNENNTGGPTISGITTYSGRHFFVPPVGDTASRPEDCEPGSLRFNTDTAHLEYFRGNTIGWTEIEASSPELGGGTSSSNQNALGARAIAGGGFLGVRTREFVTVSTTGDSQDFGDLTEAGGIHGRQIPATETRMLFSGGYINNAIEFITVASTGDSTDFGDKSVRRYAQTGVNDTIRGILGGGASTTPFVPSHGAETNMIEYVTIAQQGNAVDFGDMVHTKSTQASVNSTTRGIIQRSNTPLGPVGVMDTIIMRSTGNATDFGDVSSSQELSGGICNATRGIFSGGFMHNVIQYITMATEGNTIDFGDMLQVSSTTRGASSKTRGLIVGGHFPSGGGYPYLNVIQSVQIATTGNSVDFGDMAYAGGDVSQISCNSNAHGGI